MPYIETRGGARTKLFYIDWEPRKPRAQERAARGPVVFLSAWGLSTDCWRYQMIPLGEQGYRCIAYDRRGHGRSDDPGRGYDFDTLADDLGELLEQLDLRDVTLVAHSLSGGEAVRYLTRHGSGRIARLVLIGTSMPLLLKREDNPDGLDPAIVAAVRATWIADYPKWLADNARPFFVEETSPETVGWLIHLMMQTSMKALIECSHLNFETDFRGELRALNIPTLLVHGTKDMSNPLEFSGRKAAPLIANSRLEIYEGAPHGLIYTHTERFNADLVGFIEGR